MTKRTPKTTKTEPTARRNDTARPMDVLAMELDNQ